MGARLPPLPRQTPSLTAGVLAAAACVVVETLLLYPLRQFEPDARLGVVYLLGVLVISIVWGLRLGLATAVVSGIAYDYFHLPPFHAWNLQGAGDWVTLPLFLAVALLIGFVADLARSRSIEADEQRRTADLTADLAHLLLRAESVRSALPTAAQCLARALELPYAAIEPEVVAADEHHEALPLRDGATQIATLLVPAGLPEPTLLRLRRQVVPSLQDLLSTARDREAFAQEQAALRRIATLVACGTNPCGVFDAVACEMGRILRADYTAIERHESEDSVSVMGSWSDHERSGPRLPVGSRWSLGGESLSPAMWRTGRPVRLGGHEQAPGELAAWARERGIKSSIGSPITVEGRLWGVVIALWSTSEPPADDVEERMSDFTELVATAIANTESRAELTASRARIVAAADESRRRIERDLHDGAQQRLVTVGLELRAAEVMAPPELKAHLSHTAENLTSAVEDLQELSRGLHPAILSKGGLRLALKTLARRSTVPVELILDDAGCQPEPIGAALYYIASEALTNATKHAHASTVHIDLSTDETAVRLCIRDDGIGGADPDQGSGLIGLKDRVAVLGGEMEIISPAGSGTSLLVTIPAQ